MIDIRGGRLDWEGSKALVDSLSRIQSNIGVLMRGQERLLQRIQRMLMRNEGNNSEIVLDRVGSKDENAPEKNIELQQQQFNRFNRLILNNVEEESRCIQISSDQENQNYNEHEEERSKIDMGFYEHSQNDFQEYYKSLHNEGRLPLERLASTPKKVVKKDDFGLEGMQKILKSLRKQFEKMDLSFTDYQEVYRYPQMEDNASKDKFLDRSNVLLLMKLASDQVIGAFSEVAFSSKPVLIPRDNPRCCLFNLTKHHFLYASKTNKTHSVDRSYLMFGNWQIKLKLGQKFLQSDVGKKGGCFMREGFGGKEMLAGETREWLFCESSVREKMQLSEYVIFILR